jgi:hypothetical protein
MQRGQIAAIMARRKKRSGARPAPIPGRSGPSRPTGETIPANQRIPPPPSTVKEGAPTPTTRVPGTPIGKRSGKRPTGRLNTSGYGKPTTDSKEPRELTQKEIDRDDRGTSDRNRMTKKYLRGGGKQEDVDAYFAKGPSHEQFNKDADAYQKSKGKKGFRNTTGGDDGMGNRPKRGGSGALKKLKHVFKRIKKQIPAYHQG